MIQNFGNSRKGVFHRNICRLARDGFLRNMSNSEIDIGLVQQLDSARADIQFLSKNHAETLKGLHSEIKSLQQSNRELQFQLTFAKTNDELELKINQLEMENTKYKSKMNEMVSFTCHTIHTVNLIFIMGLYYYGLVSESVYGPVYGSLDNLVPRSLLTYTFIRK